MSLSDSTSCFAFIFPKISSLLTCFFSASLCRIKFLLPEVTQSSVKRLSSINYHRGETILYNSPVFFFFLSNQIFLLLNTLHKFWVSSYGVPHHLRISVLHFTCSAKIPPRYLTLCTFSLFLSPVHRSDREMFLLLTDKHSVFLQMMFAINIILRLWSPIMNRFRSPNTLVLALL